MSIPNVVYSDLVARASTLEAQNSELANIVKRYMGAYPAFRIKPEGAPGSQARDEQERLMALEDAALAALAKSA